MENNGCFIKISFAYSRGLIRIKMGLCVMNDSNLRLRQAVHIQNHFTYSQPYMPRIKGNGAELKTLIESWV